MFTDLAADAVVSGGQTMNPSTEDILKEIDATPAEIVFVLPLSLIHILPRLGALPQGPVSSAYRAAVHRQEPAADVW